MPVRQVLTTELECTRCGHRWLQRRGTTRLPRVCCHCKSRYWNVEKGTHPRGRPRKIENDLLLTEVPTWPVP